MVKNPPAKTDDTGLIPGSGRSPGEEMATIPVFLPGKSNGQRGLVGYAKGMIWQLNNIGNLQPLLWQKHIICK